MKSLVLLLFLLGLVLLIAFGFWVHKKQKEAHASFQSIIKDAELFQLIHKMNHFINAEQLAEATGVEVKMAKRHLSYLHQYGALQTFYNASGTSTGVYQLAEDVPLEAIPKMDVAQMSDQEVITTILQYSSDYQLTTAELVVIFDIDIYKAKALIKRLSKSKKVSFLVKGTEVIYVISPDFRHLHPSAELAENNIKEALQGIRDRAIPKWTTTERIKIPDADVIQLAIEHDGRLTPTLLCLKRKISIEEAKQRLEELYEQGTFVMDVDETNFVMQYQLRDKSLLE